MEMIAASKIKKAQKAVQNNKPYAEKITEILNRMLKSAGRDDRDDIEHPYMQTNEASTRKLVIAVSPDKGLAGALNSNLYKKLLEFSPDVTDVVVIGKKIERFASRMGYKLIASFPFGTRFPEYSVIYPLTGIIKKHYIGKNAAEVHVIFTEFKSIFSFSPASVKLLPIKYPLIEGDRREFPYKFEPGADFILRELIPYYVEVKLYNAIVQAYTSEQAARMVAMGGAKDNALDIMDFITLTYNKIRQERITNEILDLANGRIE
jgi:F-type H+-transporting ATPase subunit gamma